MSDSDFEIDAVLDVGQFVRDQRTWHGDIQVARFARLQHLLASTAGEISVAMVGRFENKKLWLDFSINGEVSLVCQRCLLPVTVPVDSDVELRVVDSVEGVTPEHGGDEEWSVEDIEDTVVTDRPWSLLELVEDEIVLALPMAATHDECELVTVGNKSDALSPFAALRALKSDLNKE